MILVKLLILTSYNTTFVTLPICSASSLTSSFNSKSNVGSSLSSSSVNICLRTTTLELVTEGKASASPLSSSLSQSLIFLK